MTTTTDANGSVLPRPRPMTCHDCGAPAFYDYDADQYDHVLPPDRERGCFLIAPALPLPFETLAAVLAAYGWAEIVEDFRGSDVETPDPATVAGFSDLHDYCDANEYALLCDPGLVLPQDDWERIGRVVQDAIHDRIARGDLLRELNGK